MIDEAAVATYIAETLPNVETAENYGYIFFFYDSDHKLPFATMASSDNEYDRVSNLDRPGVFRLNIGVGRETFRSFFGDDAGDMSRYDFTALDIIMPHPHYAAQHFICVLSPSDATFERVSIFLDEAYQIAKSRNAKRIAG